MSDTTATDATPDETAQATTIDSDETPDEIDWKDKYEGQKKVNTDLERKFKKLAFDTDELRLAADLATKPAEEQAAEAARAKAVTEATAKANQRILKADLRAAATGKLADPTDAALYIDLTAFTVSDDGEVDSDALSEAINDLLERKPHLAAGKPARFEGGADQGAKGATAKPSQITQSELDRMSNAEITAARAEGRLNLLLGIN